MKNKENTKKLLKKQKILKINKLFENNKFL